MDFVTPVATPIVESLIVPFKRQLSFLVSSSEYVRDMHAKLTILVDTAHDMDTKQMANFAKGLVVPHYVPKWLEEVEKIKVRAGRIPTGRVGCSSIKMRYKAGKESFDILKVIDHLMKEKAEMVWNNERIPLAMVTSPTASAAHDDYQNKIESRDLILNDALKFLEPNNNKTQKMALCGMAGVGKTTMMEQLKNFAKDRKMFDWIVKVDVGQNPNPLVVQQIVAEYLGEALTETTKDTRAERLRKRFEKMSEDGKKKILLIMDDVWEEFNLQDVGLTSPLPNDFKLLFTSRDENVCTRMGVENSLIFKIVPLKDMEAKKLFWETAGLGLENGIEPDVHKIGEDIIKRCGGLPIAIKTIAATLRDNMEKDEWEDALYRLQNKNFHDLDIKAIFEISYKNLKDDDLKAIFLLSGLFPEDYNISKEDLLRYGWGLKFFKNVHSIAKARSRVNTCVNKLIRSNLLIKSDHEGCVKMHDLMRDFVLSNFSEVKQASIVNHDNNVSEQLKEEESYERILLKCRGMFEFPVDFNYPTLSLLQLMDGDKLLKFPDNFYTRMEKLKVVAYENMHQLLLPQYSTNLRTLSLRSCSLAGDDISSLGDLINLEVLSLVNCDIHKLPHNLRKLKMLKLLDVTGCANLCIDDGVFQNLHKLEELYMGVSNWSAIRFTDTNCVELDMLSRKLSALELEFFENKAQPKHVSFDQLERFRISIGCFLERNKFRWSYCGEYSIKNTLRLVISRKELLECKIHELFKKTEILYLEVYDMKHLEDVSTLPPQNSFVNLKELFISNCADLTCLFTIPVAKGLRKLERLVISWCPVLKEIWSSEITSGEVEVNNISMLRKIEVTYCDSLVNLFPNNPMRFLGHLEELTVRGCGSIDVLFNIDLGKIEQLSASSSSLRSIIVFNLENLRHVWRIKDVENKYSDHLIHCFQAVESLDIWNCGRFRNIVTPTTTNFDMRALKDINIRRCGEYGERKNESAKNHQEQEINTLSKEKISKVGILMSIVAFPHDEITYNFHHLRNVKLNKYEGVEAVFEIMSPSNKDQLATTQQQSELLPYLDNLELMGMNALTNVWKCKSWNKFFIFHKHEPQSSFKNLTSIKLSNCKNIKFLFSPLMMKLLSNLKKVMIRECDGMEEVVSSRDDGEKEIMTSTFAYATTTLFPHLHLLSLIENNNLKHIGGGVAKSTTNVGRGQSSKISQAGVVSWSLCQYTREISIVRCDVLSSVIPSYAAGQMQKLEVLSIERCKSLTEVLETKETGNDNIIGCSSSSTTVAIPRPTTRNMHKLPNLKILKIVNCDCLESIFTFSTLESLNKLEILTIGHCEAMKVIVKEEYGQHTMASSKEVVFPHLKSIELARLPNLAGFFLETSIDFQWPLLDYVMINDCPQMMVFTYGQSTTPKLNYIHTELGKHNLEGDLNFHMTPTLHQTPSLSLDGLISRPTIPKGRPWSFHGLTEINVINNDKLKKIIPSTELQQLQKLETIQAKWCYNVEEVFEVAMEVTNNEAQTVVKFPKLREMDLKDLYSLKYIWKINHRRILEFPNLTRLSIDSCNSLEHVFTCSMVDCLVQLQELHIQCCVNMEVIVKEEIDYDAKLNGIKFPCLKSLKLDNNSSLKGLCLAKEDFTFPLLDTLVIMKCPRITVFTEGRSFAPKLIVVETSSGLLNVGEDINSSIMTKRQEGFEF